MAADESPCGVRFRPVFRKNSSAATRAGSSSLLRRRTVPFSNWLGVYLDTIDNPIDWDEIAAIVEDAYRLVAPKSLIAVLDAL